MEHGTAKASIRGEKLDTLHMLHMVIPPTKAAKDGDNKPIRRVKNDKAANHWGDLKDLDLLDSCQRAAAAAAKTHKQMAVNTIPKTGRHQGQ
ncbi:hypothetical protein PV08_05990 [Exophiala spinifera]|uniref:Uncharacterized protein n=1 Tax=Exophiala spinifera TaxID=91928 RepID=A0A0D2BBH0_9EURO|nr:uncharacterized protein PV08_05990 [Exophiala spinifera]KIW15940.1 hypothetical protein PV08_05990 [Exophiala spinifera]